MKVDFVCLAAISIASFVPTISVATTIPNRLRIHLVKGGWLKPLIDSKAEGACGAGDAGNEVVGDELTGDRRFQNRRPYNIQFMLLAEPPQSAGGSGDRRFDHKNASPPLGVTGFKLVEGGDGFV